ncbi:GntR family transcriptional regulator [Paraburkholderia caballeronis]|uniref:GntR family transcriptional regulator n=1 Tax=Paraburkholderia caballeronis TaxID=416943 RepID=UPI0010646E7D|nr:GntR family transcriptional regulator [Paraburkholderia caballeronis]TDV06743.1 GntR family transcriptional regulator [Paraburkholderia caballeronis]TDV09923.1 GntR family transcriptional regulator [Paraburkholderia caballeronis]TDV21755.1 GntR family transcriptional regulator [Paraburkholderia caballeronis]
MTDLTQPDSVTPIDMVRQHSLTTLVRDEIERHIAAGALRPGDKLNEAEWAARLQVSRGPVREAFRALEQAGLVRNEKHRGVFVRTVSAVEADELDVVLAALEETACRLVAARIDAALVAVLHDRLARMRDALGICDRDAYARASGEFRDAIVAAAGNGRLHDTYRRLAGELRLSRRGAQDARAAAGDETMTRSYAEHRAVLNALASRDADEAVALMRAYADDVRA